MRIEMLHPVMVHFTIGLLVAGVLLTLAGDRLKKPGALGAGLWALGLGAGFAVLAVTTGLISEDRVGADHNAALSDLLEIHETLALTTLSVLAVTALGWRFVRAGRWAKLRPWLHLLGLAGVLLVLATGYYGGEMVYNHGAAVQVNGKAVTPQDPPDRPTASQPAGPAAARDGH